MRIAGVVVAALLALTGCANVPPAPSTPVPSTPAAVPSPSPSATSPLAPLSQGACTGPLPEAGEESTSIAVRACSQAHSWEVAAVVPLTVADYPGEAGLKALAASECTAAFRDYVGVAAESSPYSVTFVGPGESHWANPDARKLVCLVGTDAGGLTFSLKDRPVVFAETGQCLGEPAAGSTTYPLVACSQAHLYEVYASSKLSGSTAPTRSELDKAYNRVCVTGFRKFVGVQLAKSKYEIQYFVLPAGLWKKFSDHRLVCSAGSPSGGITGSLKGTRK